MKILIYGINFAPELTGIGKYTGEMVEWLVAQGHEVRVVTAPPYYPAWAVSSPYSAARYTRTVIQVAAQGAAQTRQSAEYQVWRCPLWVPGKVSGAKRLLHLASFAVSSLPVMLRQVLWRPDVVWMAAPALLCAPGAWLAARLSGAKAVIHIQDYEVDAAFQLGLLKSPLARRFALWCERSLLGAFDVVSTISRRMVALAKAKGVVEESAVFFPNWVDLAAIASGSDAGLSPDHSLIWQGKPQGYRMDLGIPVDAIVALYSGNMGMKQGLEVLPEVARLLSISHPDVFFVFCGQGAGKAQLNALCGGLPNVRLLPLQPMDRLGELLTTADIHLLPQRADAADLVMPSKLTGMLASGRPVVATAQPGTELADVVASCGLVVEPENAFAMAQAVLRLAGDSSLRALLGGAGRAYAERCLDKDVVLKRYWQGLGF
jgi:colanic acid biosynthesis glycosyl transferase WcaI